MGDSILVGLENRTVVMCHKFVTQYDMPSVNMRELRDTRRLKAWLRSGKTVELRDRQEVIARIIPAHEHTSPENWPDFGARRHKIFGKKVLSGAELVAEERGRF